MDQLSILRAVESHEFIEKKQLADWVKTDGFTIPANRYKAHLKRFNTVFIMDCTYKTNKFGMPLLR
jgi:hypothetical protein